MIFHMRKEQKLSLMKFCQPNKVWLRLFDQLIIKINSNLYKTKRLINLKENKEIPR